jgi:hypothetical protein
LAFHGKLKGILAFDVMSYTFKESIDIHNLCRKEQIIMKKVKSIVKTLLFSVFMAVVVSTAGDTVRLIENPMENSIATCCEEYPSAEQIGSGY